MAAKRSRQNTLSSDLNSNCPETNQLNTTETILGSEDLDRGERVGVTPAGFSFAKMIRGHTAKKISFAKESGQFINVIPFQTQKILISMAILGCFLLIVSKKSLCQQKIKMNAFRIQM